MEKFCASFEVYSPRWGHTDSYFVSFSPDRMVIRQNKEAICVLNEDGEAEWSGYGEGRGNPLMNIFSNDMIHAPVIVPFALKWAWEKWRAGRDNETTRKGLAELFAWIDQTARGKPESEFWEGAF